MSQPTSQIPGPSADPPARRRVRASAWWLAAALLLLAGAVTAYLCWQRARPEVPGVPSEGLEPAVAATIEKARANVTQSPRSGAAWGRLGMVLLAHHFPTEAEVCLLQADRLDGNDPRWPYHLGVQRALQGADDAVPLLRRAAELAGDRVDAPRLRLADLLLEQNRADEARAAFERLVRRHPDHPPAHLGLARLAYQRDDLDECLRQLPFAEASRHTRKAAHGLKAAVLERRNDSKAADRELARANRLPDDKPWPDPFTDEVQQLRVNKRSRTQDIDRLLAEGRFADVVALVEPLVREDPDFDLAWRALGFARLQQGDVPGAAKALRTALRLAPDAADAHYYMGSLLLREGKPQEALGYFGRATDLKRDYAVAYYSQAECLKRLGDANGAVDALRKALGCRPYMAEAHRELGRLLAEGGHKADALQHLHTALQMAPQDAQAAELLRKLEAGRHKPAP